MKSEDHAGPCGVWIEDDNLQSFDVGTRRRVPFPSDYHRAASQTSMPWDTIKLNDGKCFPFRLRANLKSDGIQDMPFRA